MSEALIMSSYPTSSLFLPITVLTTLYIVVRLIFQGTVMCSPVQNPLVTFQVWKQSSLNSVRRTQNLFIFSNYIPFNKH